jgi:hypothetical protein
MQLDIIIRANYSPFDCCDGFQVGEMTCGKLIVAREIRHFLHSCFLLSGRDMRRGHSKQYEDTRITVFRGSVVRRDTMLKAGRSRVRFPRRTLDFPIDIILLRALWPWDRLSL